MYYVMRASAPSLHRESTDSLIDEIRITSSELVCASYEPIYVPIIIYCLRPFVVVYKHVILL